MLKYALTNKLNNTFDISSLEKYMLHNIDYTIINSNNTNNNNSNNSNNSNNNSNNSNNVDTKQNIYVKYTKKYSKYNEPIFLKKNNNFTDKLFWCFYKLLNNLLDKDLEHENCFKLEKDFKYGIVEKIRKNKSLLKSAKIRKFNVEDDLINNKCITLQTFECLCLIHNLNVILIKNNAYTCYCYDLDNKTININNYKIIELDCGEKNENNNYKINKVEILDKIAEYELQDRINKMFYIENLEKPLKAFSSYKLDELISISEKLNINIYDTNNKKRKKQELYSDILNYLK